MKGNAGVARILLIASIILMIGALVTLIPFAGASKPNIMGYRSLCSFSPVSTIILLFGANTCYGIRKKKFF
ncbi:MAG: hypothetical protein KKD44_07045 [Proteobacteria bacterium]|nr:hypothetical protein [Pseudomonadota bacterium]